MAQDSTHRPVRWSVTSNYVHSKCKLSVAYCCCTAVQTIPARLPSRAARAIFWLAVQACVGNVSWTLTISSLAQDGYTA